MCGISGFISLIENSNYLNLFNNKNLLNHRGPDNFSNWTNYNNTVCLFHNRLSVIDIDNRSNQPMTSSSGRFVIIFNGEIYNFKELKINLERIYKTNFKTHSDTEVLLECIENYGLKDALSKISGMFAFVLYDKENDIVSLVRDPVGEKPLYYYHDFSNNIIFFSSEIKLFKKINLNLTINPLKVQEFFLLGYTNGEETLFKNVIRLFPGTIYDINRKNNALNIITYQYFDSSKLKNNNSTLSLDDHCNFIENKLIDILKNQTLTDRKTGFFLSSGLDSTLLVTLASRYLDTNPETFTLKICDEKFDESKDANRIANYLNTNHHEVAMSKLDIIDAAINCKEVFCDPISDSSQIPTLFLSKKVSSKVTVILGGDGGDEIFSGYRRYRTTYYIWQLKAILKIIKLNKIPSPILKLINIFLNQRQVRKLESINNLNNINEIYLNLVSFLNTDSINFNDIFHKISFNNSNCKYSIMDELMLWDFSNYLTNDLLLKIDRSAMNYGLETRSPYLDLNLIKYCWGINRELIHNDKLIQKKILSNYIPAELISAEKKGFGSPLSKWITNDLNELIHDEFYSRKFIENDFIDSKQMQNMLKKQVLFNEDWSHEIWSNFIFSQWHNEYC